EEDLHTNEFVDLQNTVSIDTAVTTLLGDSDLLKPRFSKKSHAKPLKSIGGEVPQDFKQLHMVSCNVRRSIDVRISVVAIDVTTTSVDCGVWRAAETSLNVLKDCEGIIMIQSRCTSFLRKSPDAALRRVNEPTANQI